jgi:hypothetical protein
MAGFDIVASNTTDGEIDVLLDRETLVSPKAGVGPYSDCVFKKIGLMIKDSINQKNGISSGAEEKRWQGFDHLLV